MLKLYLDDQQAETLAFALQIAKAAQKRSMSGASRKAGFRERIAALEALQHTIDRAEQQAVAGGLKAERVLMKYPD